MSETRERPPQEQQEINVSTPVDLLHNDGDPRKRAYVLYLMDEAREYWHVKAGEGGKGAYTPSIFRLHKAEGLLEKNEKGERKHKAPEHIITVMTGMKALGKLLGLQGDNVRDLLIIGAVHDVNKDIEFKLVRGGIDDPNAGYGQKGYDFAGDISEQKLRFAGVPEEIIEVHDKTGHASCPEIEKLLQDSTGRELSSKELKSLILHYIDDIVTNPNIIDPAITEDEAGIRLNALDRRCIQNENNPTYKNYNTAWKTDPRNRTGETAFAMQRRVGHLVETRLAERMGVEDPLTLPQRIYEEMQRDVQENWNRKHH